MSELYDWASKFCKTKIAEVGDAARSAVAKVETVASDTVQKVEAVASSAETTVSETVQKVETKATEAVHSVAATAGKAYKAVGAAIDKSDAAAKKVPTLGSLADAAAKKLIDGGAALAQKAVDAAPLPQGMKDAAHTYVKFEKGLATGVYEGAKDLVEGAHSAVAMVDGEDLAKGVVALGKAAFSEKARAQLVTDVKDEAKSVAGMAKFGAELIVNPVGVGTVIGGQIRDGYEKAAAKGEGTEFIGEGVGKVVVAVGSFFVGGEAGEAAKAAQAAKEAKLAEEAAAAAKAAQDAKLAEEAAAAAKAAQDAKLAEEAAAAAKAAQDAKLAQEAAAAAKAAQDEKLAQEAAAAAKAAQDAKLAEEAAAAAKAAQDAKAADEAAQAAKRADEAKAAEKAKATAKEPATADAGGDGSGGGRGDPPGGSGDPPGGSGDPPGGGGGGGGDEPPPSSERPGESQPPGKPPLAPADQPPPVDGQVRKPVDPKKLNFSQKTAGAKMSDGSTVDDVARNMEQKGWDPTKPDPDVVEFPDGTQTSLDNRRIVAARQANLPEIPATVHSPTEPIPESLAERFQLRQSFTDENGTRYVKGSTPKNWGEAVKFRARNQGGSFPLKGSPNPPKLN